MTDKKIKGAYDHLKREVAEKQKTSRPSTGIPIGVKVTFVGFPLQGGLMFSGAFTGDLGSNNQQDPNIGDPIDTSGEVPVNLLDLCVEHGGMSAHYHYNIAINVDGASQVIPANVGISSTCMKPLHTHDTSGKIHVEPPSNYNGPSPDVEDFFTVWGKTTTTTSIRNWSGEIVFELNGQTSDLDYRTYVPRDGDEITLYIS